MLSLPGRRRGHARQQPVGTFERIVLAKVMRILTVMMGTNREGKCWGYGSVSWLFLVVMDGICVR